MNSEQYRPDKNGLIDLVSESPHLTVLHYGIWFEETARHLGLDKAIEMEDVVWGRVVPIFRDRLAKRLDASEKCGIAEYLAVAGKEELMQLLTDMAKNWLASDGVWFQTIEKDSGISTAKKINDACWYKFSYLEARRIAKKLNLPQNGGIPSLKEALKYRQYALVNRQEIVEAGENKLVFRMNECRVQLARKRANLPDYPCKSAGMVEYTRFAEGIDARIRTTCLGCPPDPHPAEWFCAWEFTL